MKRSNRILKSVQEVVDALGGPSAVGARWGIGQSAVSNWILRGYLPPGWHLRIYLTLKRMGLRAHPSVYGLEEDEDPLPDRRSKRRTESRVAA